MDRRTFLRNAFGATGAAAGLALLPGCHAPHGGKERAIGSPGATGLLRISLAEWSLHKALHAGEMSNLDFPAWARAHGIGAVEYVNSFFKDKANDQAYLAELESRCIDANVRSLLIMVDGEGQLGHPDAAQRRKAVENHYQWVEAAQYLGCHSIRVNAAGGGDWDSSMNNAASGLRQLCQFADGFGVNVIVENHGGLSSNGAWLAGVMKKVDHPRAGTLPDFGNFRISNTESYDRYQGVRELMPYAKAVSAKSHDFDENGDEKHTDYGRMLQIVREAGYAGYVGIEFEGGGMTEEAGIMATKALLEKHGAMA